ncbi:MAG: cyclopropane-fatty-acyl-phospholipid synthase family protein [Candidatus Sericytochromatia bacterium]|nr:cyclopropane-fatty-acyl-phospholipid synthase family protein [Candidatus Sericytochromatia bacterium]
MLLDTVLSTGLVPDPVIRWGIRKLLRDHLAVLPIDRGEATERYVSDFVSGLSGQAIAVQTAAANAQHYELPTAFFQAVLGPHLKYSSGWWEQPETDLLAGLAESERAMLALSCARAELADGQDVLELGCGWGSLSLYMAEHYPRSRILSISNSRTQREFILAEAERRGLTNLEVETCDINAFQTVRQFDRVVSVEMFEHMRNYDALLGVVQRCLRPEGRLFVHIFTHRQTPYLFESRSERDWMARYFFSGGMMPHAGIFTHYPHRFTVVNQWTVNGRHYHQTSEAWLRRMDTQRAVLAPLFQATYGTEARRWWTYWRIFFMACSELFAHDGGQEWFVSHYLLRPTPLP